VLLERSTITATGTTGVAVQAAPNTFVELFAYTRPSTDYVLVRSGTTDNTGVVTFTPLRPPANTRLQARQRGCAFGESKVLNVRTYLSLEAARTGTRDYTFRGQAIPARPNGLIVSLYRVTFDGREVLTAQTRANANVGQEGYDASSPPARGRSAGVHRRRPLRLRRPDGARTCRTLRAQQRPRRVV
jgi:hypothetical protein